MVMTALTWISFTEEWTIAYPYVRTRYHWGLTEYTQYKSIVQASTIGGKLGAKLGMKNITCLVIL